MLGLRHARLPTPLRCATACHYIPHFYSPSALTLARIRTLSPSCCLWWPPEAGTSSSPRCPRVLGPGRTAGGRLAEARRPRRPLDLGDVGPLGSWKGYDDPAVRKAIPVAKRPNERLEQRRIFLCRFLALERTAQRVLPIAASSLSRALKLVPGVLRRHPALLWRAFSFLSFPTSAAHADRRARCGRPSSPSSSRTSGWRCWAPWGCWLERPRRSRRLGCRSPRDKLPGGEPLRKPLSACGACSA